MLPNRLLQTALRGAHTAPRYLDESDQRWLGALIDEYARFAGRRRAELDARLGEPLPTACPPGKLAQAVHVLDRLCRDQTRAAVKPAAARAALALEAAAGGGRERILRRAGERMGVDGELLVECMLADLPGEKRVCALPEEINASQLRLRVNLAIAQSLASRATRVQIFLLGNARDIVRHAHLRGLLCTVRRANADGIDRTILDISGPLSLFKHTAVYARALASLVPRLSWCDRFELRAQYLVEQQPRVLVIRSGDPIFPCREPRRFDSELEARFYKDFNRAAPDWQVVREPEPVAAGDSIIFPDFALFHRRQPERRWLVEIAGFWTPGYLAHKLDRLRQACIDNLILCIDQERNCAEEDLPARARMVRYRRRVDPAEVLRIIEGK